MRILRIVFVLCVGLCAFGGAAFGQTIKCSSDDGGRNYCKADTSNGVALVRQISGAACQQGYSWDYDRGGIWVDHGCRAEFALQAPPSTDRVGRTMTCSSDDGGKHYCDVDTRGGVALIQQRSGASCQQGVSWGYDERGIWVDHGCRADFALSVSPDGRTYNNGGGFGGNGQTLTCSSNDGGRNFCATNIGGGYVELLRQRSQADCVQGDSWGYDPRGIWVDHGCRADFLIGSDGNNGGGPGYPNPPTQTVSCSSDDGGRRTCPTDTTGGVQMVKQRSGASCQQGYSWDYDRNGIWVDKGCRADFLVGGNGVGTGPQGRACYRSVGDQRAKQLVQQCLQVSPATHPPCNADNSCRLLTDEIRRSCQLLGRDAPGFCDEYR